MTARTFTIRRQYLKDLHLDCPRADDLHGPKGPKNTDIQMRIDVHVRRQDPVLCVGLINRLTLFEVPSAAGSPGPGQTPPEAAPEFVPFGSFQENSLTGEGQTTPAPPRVEWLQLRYEYVAMVRFLCKLSADEQRHVLFYQVPTLLFPFGRALVAQCTREAGFQPVLLKPFDFTPVYQRAQREIGLKGTNSGTGSETAAFSPEKT